MEQTLDIRTKGAHKSISLKTSLKNGIRGIDSGNYIVVKKLFAEGRMVESKLYTNAKGEPSVSYSCLVEYNGNEVYFWLSPKEHRAFAAAGGEGDKVKISLNKEPYVNPISGVEMILQKLSFEVVED